MKKTGIYKISSKSKNRIYVGSAVDIKRRFYLHKVGLQKNEHHSVKLQRHVNKYGIDDLTFEILEIVELKENLTEREQFYIDTLNPYFNICKIAGNCTGRKMSEKTKKKLKEVNTGRPAWNKGKKGVQVGWNKGMKMPKEFCEKLRQAHLGYIPSEETKLKLSLAYTEKSSRKGAKLTEEHKKAISDFNKQNPNDGMFIKGQEGLNKGNKASPGTIEKLRIANLGQIPWNLGKKLSKESIEKRTETRRKNREAKMALNPKLPKEKKVNTANFKLVLNTETGIYYDNAKTAHIDSNYSYSAFARMLNGGRNNKTNFIYA